MLPVCYEVLPSLCDSPISVQMDHPSSCCFQTIGEDVEQLKGRRESSQRRPVGRVCKLPPTCSYDVMMVWPGDTAWCHQFATFLSFQGEIRASCFNETADKFAAIFESGKVPVIHYLILVT